MVSHSSRQSGRAYPRQPPRKSAPFPDPLSPLRSPAPEVLVHSPSDRTPPPPPCRQNRVQEAPAHNRKILSPKPVRCPQKYHPAPR